MTVSKFNLVEVKKLEDKSIGIMNLYYIRNNVFSWN